MSFLWVRNCWTATRAVLVTHAAATRLFGERPKSEWPVCLMLRQGFGDHGRWQATYPPFASVLDVQLLR
jgi:hypothetical protein